MIDLAWIIRGCGAGHDTVADVEKATQTLARACETGSRHMSAPEQSQTLLGMVPSLRLAMMTTGRKSLERSGYWELSQGVVFVRMRTRD